MRILLVDDDPFALRLLTRQLKLLGISMVTTSECPVAALSVLTDDPQAFDLVILDLNMPRMDGIEFVREIAWQHYSGAVLFLSGADERIIATAETLARAEQLTVAGRLKKPVSTDDLRHKLAEVAEVEVTSPRLPVAQPRLFTAEELACAVRRSELINHYQPQVSFSDGRIVGVEALVRWNHPVEGLVFPDRFITLAEKTGFMPDVTQSVLRSALIDATEWLRIGLAVRLSVNVSAGEVTALDFPDKVAQHAQDIGFPLDHLTLEVTESQVVEDWSKTLAVAARLRLKGIGLAIDDYGTGYSSLRQLRDLPFDELKLDRSFVSGAAETASLRPMVTSTVDMAHQMGVKVVAEGIEDSADWNFLRDLGCDLGQGYLIGRPMHNEDLLGWAEHWRHHHSIIEETGT